MSGAKIRNLDSHGVIQQAVLGLDVPVDDSNLMHKKNCVRHLGRVEPGTLKGKRAVLEDDFLEIPVGREVQHKVCKARSGEDRG